MIPLMVLVAMCLVFIYSIVQSPDILAEIKQRIAPSQVGHDAAPLTLNYCADGKSSHVGDFYPAIVATTDANSRASRAPVVVIVHGGSWSKGDRHEMDYMARFLAARHFAVFNIETSLVGSGGGFPRDICDTKSAVSYLRENADRLKISLDRIFLLGLSSGAHVVLMAAYTPDREPFIADHKYSSAAKVSAVAAIAAPCDLQAMGKDDIVGPYLKAGGYEADPKNLKMASPVNYVGGAVPTILVHGTADHNVPYQQSVELADLLKERGVPCQLIAVEGADHFIMGTSKDLGLGKIADYFERF